ncbi:porin family protein [Aquimarina agarivorans]|uniref:porin family protein n=1 Tax=Aquimarina agarivorans TaxID=980584 RepID=UPI000248E821|nr:porin family protein [Aquimarina agarivorans]
MKYLMLFITTLISIIAFGQQEQSLVFPEVDSLYREDQVYLGITFNVIGDRPETISQSGFSGGLHLGVIRDIPFNKKRSFGLGLGLGYSVNTYNHTLVVIPDNATVNQTTFVAATDENSTGRSQFITHLVELPLELRWRTSTPSTYKFWRIYAGMRFGYMHFFSAKFKDNNGVEFKERKPDGLDRLRLGATLSFGWNTFNFHLYYSLNSFFDKSVQIEDQQGGFSVVKLGLMFYIL